MYTGNEISVLMRSVNAHISDKIKAHMILLWYFHQYFKVYFFWKRWKILKNFSHCALCRVPCNNMVPIGEGEGSFDKMVLNQTFSQSLIW